MQFRLARHTTDLQQITDFYCGILGMEILGKFNNHNGYDGIFIGNQSESWHLEFTVSDEKPVHQSDEDDLLVFYAETDAEFQKLKANFAVNNIEPIKAKNPYWNENGLTYQDPDGFRIVITKK